MKIGDIVYLITDPEQSPRMITKILIEPTQVQFLLAFGTISSWHYEIEICPERDPLKAMGLEKEAYN
jgi:hypothetical protein